MKVSFGNGSTVRTARLSWEMHYPWPPFHQRWENEPGLQIRLSARDADFVIDAIGAGVAVATGALGGALAAFSGVLPVIVGRLVKDDDGAMTIAMSAHGFQVGNLPAADPNGWIDGAWTPVANALALLGSRAADTRLRMADDEGPVVLPLDRVPAKGILLNAAPDSE